MATATGIGAVTISGIQDVSAFLPLLGTEQCEQHVSSTLERGFFYAAGSPMSTFGSLGIIKAGFTALWVSVDKPPWHGPRQLRNAGFFPKGVMGKLAYAWDMDDSIYVAEDNLRPILHRYSTISVTLNLRCWAWVRWNLLLSLFTIGFGSMGLTPYIHIIKSDLGSRPFSQTWLYPMLRVYGCVLITIMLQLITQLRILVVVHSRLRFHALNSWFQENGRVPPVSWNTETRAEESLAKLASDITSHLKGVHNANLQNTSDDHSNCQYLHDLEDSDVATCPFSSFGMDPTADGNRRATHLDKLRGICLPSLLLAICRILLLGGIAAAGVGYVGCFGLIQASNSDNDIGPGAWLAIEVALCVFRLIIWASNPGFDDPPPPIAIRKGGVGSEPVTYDIGWMLDDVSVDDLHAVVIGIDETADPGIPKLKFAVKDAQSVATYLWDNLAVPTQQAKLLENPNSREIKEALENLAIDKTIRPGAPIVIYLACHASGLTYDLTPTTELPQSSRALTPVVQTRHPPTFLTSEYTRNQPDTGLSYTKLLHLIQVISENKGNNIVSRLSMAFFSGTETTRAAKTVILDTCQAGSFGRNVKFDNNASTMNEKSPVQSEQLTPAITSEYLIGYSSHVLLAACSDTQSAFESEDGGVFTKYLLKRLKSVETDEAKKLTYRGLNNYLRSELKTHPQTPVVSGNFQNRLLFNGLLARKRLGRDTSKETNVILISTEVDRMVEDVERT